MRRIKGARPSPALVVSVLAVVAAVGGTAVAANPTATTSAKVSKKQAKKIAKKQAKKQVKKVLPVGSEELATIEEKSETFTIPGNSSEARSVSCDANQRVLSGGWRWNDAPTNFNLEGQVDHRDGTGWRAGGHNRNAQPRSFTVYAYCLIEGA
jgi:hypothetical protein